MSKAITDDPYKSLGNAIILQAVNDYRAALRRIKHNPTVVDHIKPHRGDMKLFWDRGN